MCCLENSDSAQFSSLFFSEVLIEDSNGRWDINSFVLSFVGFNGWGCCWGWWKFCSSLAIRDTLLGIVGLADLGMDLVVLYFFCDFFWGLGMLKMPETIVCGDISLVLLSGLGSRWTHPVGAEGATMARRVPFPPSSMPAYIEQSMKLFVCLSAWATRLESLGYSCFFKTGYTYIHC